MRFTDSTNENCPGHKIHMYWTNFWQPTIHVHQNIFEKTLSEVCSPHLCASFGTFCAKIFNHWRHSESLNFRKNSKIDDIFLRRQLIVEFKTYFKGSLCLEKLINFGVKCAKRSVKMWTLDFYWSFFKNILLYRSSRLSKIRSVHTYAMPWTVFIGRICIKEAKLVGNAHYILL